MRRDVTYCYASGDLLENRHSYFYSPYCGPMFLEAWRYQRDEALKDEYCGDVPANVGAPTPTDHLLADIFRDIEANGACSIRLLELKKFVQRFEVTKRLYAAYDERWLPADGSDYTGLERYVRFAESLILAYGVTDFLPFLNALLKCLDTLTALRRALTAAQMERLAALIVQERAFIQELARSTGAACDT